MVTEVLGVRIWVPALLWPMAYTALYYHTGVIHHCKIESVYEVLIFIFVL